MLNFLALDYCPSTYLIAFTGFITRFGFYSASLQTVVPHDAVSPIHYPTPLSERAKYPDA